VREPAMSIESVLVYLHAWQNTEAVLDVAVDIARRHRAHLAGLHVPARTSEEDLPGVSDQAQAFERAFREHAEKAHLSHSWNSVQGDPEEVVALESRSHDLLIIGQAAPGAESAWAWHHDLLESVLVESGHALIAVPYQPSTRSVGDRVLIAWNGAREAARATEDAMPILEKARQAIVLTIDLRSGDALSVDHLVQLLQRHGVNAEARGARSHGRAVGEVLLSQARELRCDLLVMGGFGHAWTREHLFGGPTYAVLKQLTVPVLLSH
jgi:nucleotide-binding universal stress UspA family protein